MKITVTDRAGHPHVVDGLEGWTLMEVLRDHGMNKPALALKAECGGALSCATCHVYLDATAGGPAVVPDSIPDLIPAPSVEETERLDDAFELRPTSRLSCQIVLSEARHDGLHVTLAPGTEVDHKA